MCVCANEYLESKKLSTKYRYRLILIHIRKSRRKSNHIRIWYRFGKSSDSMHFQSHSHFYRRPRSSSLSLSLSFFLPQQPHRVATHALCPHPALQQAICSHSINTNRHIQMLRCQLFAKHSVYCAKAPFRFHVSQCEICFHRPFTIFRLRSRFTNASGHFTLKWNWLPQPPPCTDTGLALSLIASEQISVGSPKMPNVTVVGFVRCIDSRNLTE